MLLLPLHDEADVKKKKQKTYTKFEKEKSKRVYLSWVHIDFGVFFKKKYFFRTQKLVNTFSEYGPSKDVIEPFLVGCI